MKASAVINTVWQFATAGNIKFGRGSSEGLLQELERWRLARPLIVTDRRLMATDGVAKIVERIRSKSLAAILFDGCVAEPSVAIAEAAIEAGRSGNADGVIGIGGGSNLDVSKMAAAVLKHGGKPSDYFGFDAIPGPILPLFAVPTTAGTGSEVSHSSVLSDPVSSVKVSSLSRWLRPLVAIVDPSLTDSCPPTVTAHSGIDALVHAIEAYTNRAFSQMVGVDPQARAYEGSYPFTRMLAAEAIQLIAKHLVRAYENPLDHEARDAMAMAAMLAGMAFSNSGVALVHALEYPIGTLTHCSHGEGNGLLLPHVMRYNLPRCEEAMAQIGQMLAGSSSPPSPLPENKERGASAFEVWSQVAIQHVVELQKSVGIRTRLSELGLKREQIPTVANKAFQIKRLMDVNPRQPNESELIEILEAAY
jgi:alcohol dehydrogenase